MVTRSSCGSSSTETAKNGRVTAFHIDIFRQRANFAAHMNLEHNIGDIIRKGRLATNTTPASAAAAAGLTEAELAAIEESGKISKQPNWAALGKTIALDPIKLQRIASGWKPSGIDVSLWRELRQITTAGDGMTVNCYLIWDEVSREAALFDTGFDAAPVFQIIDENGLNLRHLFITH